MSRVTKFFCSTLIILGLVSVATQVLIMTRSLVQIENEQHKFNAVVLFPYEIYATGIWAGCLFIFGGWAGILATKSESSCSKCMLLVPVFISFASSCAQVILGAMVCLALPNENIDGELCFKAAESCFDHKIFNWVLVGSGVAAFISSSIAFVIGLRKQ